MLRFACRKSLFFKKVLILNPYPQTPFPGKGAILLGLPPLDPVGGYAPATPFLNNQEVYLQSERSISGRYAPLFLYSELSEKRTFSAFSVIRYAFLYHLAGGVVILRKAVYAEKLIGVACDQLSVDRYIIAAKQSSALLAGLVVCHYSFTTFAVYTAQS